MTAFIGRYREHYRANFALALPVILSHAGQMVVGLADNLMVGQLGATHLAAVALANNIFVVGMMFGIGLITAVTPLAGKAFGGGDRLTAVSWLKQAAYIHPSIALLQTALMAAVGLAMPYMGQPEEVVQVAFPYYMVLVGTLLPMNFFFIYKQYAEGLGNTRIAMLITLGSNVINIVLNYILIYGKAGFPAMGIMGAGYATLISRIFMPLAFTLLFFSLKFFKPERQLWRQTRFHFREAWYMLKIGVPIGGQYIVEMLTFSLGSIMMGWMGERPLAAHQIVMSLVSFTYMVSAGFAAATTVKVSQFRGQKNLLAMKRSAHASLHMVLVFMSLSLTAFLLLRFKIPALFVPDPETVAIAGGLMLVGGLFQLFDGVQVVTLGALRGLEDVKTPMIMLVIAYFPIALPVSYVAGFVLDWGPQGVWMGYMVGLMVVGTQLLLRFRYKVNKMLA
ncbi:MAG TPA: MATE family efflux transporter [Bacteroidales bacterium]|nr:MATE family efflux transporter [Bacteroidales bacterium]